MVRGTAWKTFVLSLAAAAGAGAPAPALAAKVYVISVADTLDPKIGKSVAMDEGSFVSQFFMQVRQDLLVTKSIQGQDCEPRTILRAVESSPAGADDTLVVYFSGHGAWDPERGPYLKFPRLEEDRRYLVRKQIKQAMQARGCRLAVLLTDTCSKLDRIRIRRAPAAPAAQAPGERPAISALFRALFLDTVGFVDITSSQRGELSLAYPAVWVERVRDPATGMMSGGYEEHKGGLFTHALVSMFDRFRDRPMTWNNLTGQVSLAVRSEFRRLKPDGLDNDERPEQPQMTQTVLAFSLGTRQPRPPGFLANPIEGGAWTMGVHGYDNAGRGVYVWGTRPGSPAARIGLEQGDVILAVNGAAIRTVRAYRDAIARSGGQATIDLQDTRTQRVVRSQVQLAPAVGPAAVAPNRSVFGVAGVPVPGQGIRVTQVVPGSPAAGAGVDVNDVIQSINGRPVTTLEEYYGAVRRSSDEMWFEVLNVRTGRPLDMIVQLDR